MIADFLGYPAFFTLRDEMEPDWIAGLSERNRRLLVGAANFHALENQGAVLDLKVFLGRSGTAPSLTDLATRSAPRTAGASALGTLRVTSTAEGSRSSQPVDPEKASLFQESPDRRILLSADSDVSVFEIDRHISVYWRLRRDLERAWPIQYDYLRQIVLSRREARLQSHVIQRTSTTPGDGEPLSAAPPAAEAPGAILFGMHWFEIGGAERWALETIKLAASAGFLPIVVTDRESQHAWIDRPELRGAVLLPLTHPTGDEDESENLLRAVLENVDLRGVFVHHCQWLYDRLPWLRASRPEVPVVDSLHIIEYAGGGYPSVGVRLDNYIDVHHVISPHLSAWMNEKQGVERSKIVMAPLVGLTSDGATKGFATRRASDRLVVSFVGRFVRQKRPYLFLKLVREVHLADPGSVRAIMHGGGELDDVVAKRITDYGLEQIVELRPHDAEVRATLADSDLLVVSSQNEGLTLTTFEAIAQGIPVVSTDVGAQSTLIAAPCLLPRQPGAFVKEGTMTITEFARDDEARYGAWLGQFEKATAFSTHRSAERWAREMMSSW